MIGILKKTMPFVCIIGLIGVSVWYVFGNQPTFLHQMTIPNTNLRWYIFDMHTYLDNLKDWIRIDYNTIVPDQPTIPTFDFEDALSAGLTAVAKVLFLIINWIIYVLNIILFLPIKIIMYAILIVIAILGVNINNLRDVINTIYTFNIPYLQYSWL